MTNNPQNIAIIGAGIMGLSCAHALHNQNHTITLYDPQGFPASNASWKAGGMLAPYSEIEHMSADWIEASLDGIKAWKNFATQHANTDFHQSGSLLVAHKEDEYILERFKTHLPQETKTTISVEDLEPALSSCFTSGLYLEEEAYLNPQATLHVLYESLKENGVTFISEVRTPEDLNAQYDYIIDCRGYGAKDNDKDLRGVKGEIAIVRNTEFNLSRPVRLMHPRYPLYIIPRDDHHFMIGATMIESANEQHVSLRSGLELMSALYSLHPSFGDAQIIELTSGIRPAYPDNLPRIRTNGKVTSCNGLFRHGFLLAPVMAQCVKHVLESTHYKYTTLLTGGSDEADNKRARTHIRSAA